MATFCYNNVERLMKVVNSPFDVVNTGWILKDMDNMRGAVILLSICKEYKEYEEVKVDVIKKIVNKYRDWMKSVEEGLLWDADKIVPFFNGKKLAALFNVSTGTMVKYLVDHQSSWQFKNPTKTKEDYAAYVRENREVILEELSAKKQ